MTIWSKKATETQYRRLDLLMVWYNRAIEEDNLWAAKAAMHHYNRLKRAR